VLRRSTIYIKRELHTNQASGDLIEGVASWFYRKVHNTFLEYLIRIVQKSKKLIDNQNTGVSTGHQEEERSAHIVRC
jgi:hypothetical protein